MNDIVDMDTLYREEHKRWLREDAPRRSFRDRLAASVPYWIIVVALVLYGLSAPHTAGVFDKLTPGWGWIAPIGVEFGLLYTAFRRRLARSRQTSVPLTLWVLEILLFLTAMLVNGAGAFASVVESVGLTALSFTAIGQQFAQLPATSQAALVMAGLSAFIIPIGALVAGEGLAALALEHEDHHHPADLAWQEAEFTVIYRAVYVRYIAQGLEERVARQRAHTEVRGYLGRGSVSAGRMLSAPSAQSEPTGQNGQENGHTPNGQSGQVRANVRAYLDTHPALREQSVNQVLAHLRDDGVRAGRTTVAEVLQEMKQEA
ncbi:MAG: hypothetical protein CL610_18830 [Anaerolineaceae bacterium]|nr:hypothetical protein [Anaerolineaceae bacterium]